MDVECPNDIPNALFYESRTEWSSLVTLRN